MWKVGVYWIYITIMDVQYGVKKGVGADISDAMANSSERAALRE